MSTKLILYSIGLLILGLVIGGFAAYRFSNDRIEKSERKIIDSQRIIDSVESANKEQKRLFNRQLNQKNTAIEYYRARIKTREDDFKNDTIIPSDDELIQRIWAINNSSR